MSDLQVKRFLREIAEEQVPANLDPWDTIRARLQSDKQSRRWTWRKPLAHLSLALAALFLVLTIIIAASPDVRAQVGKVFKRIAGISFMQTDRLPDAEVPALVLNGEMVSLEQARKMVPYVLELPSWVPEGFAFEKDVRVIPRGDLTSKSLGTWSVPVALVWRNGQGHAIVLSEQLSRGWGTIQIGPNSAEEIKINGQPAVLIHGMWDGRTKEWSHTSMLQLTWRREGVGYRLSSSDRWVSVNDLIRIAESIP